MAVILLAKDDLGIARIFRRWLESSGHTVHAVENGLAGLREMTFGGQPDLLVTDVMMPEADGEDLLVSANLFATIPVVVVTAMSEGEKLDRIRATPQVRTVLKKPVQREALLAAVAAALGQTA